MQKDKLINPVDNNNNNVRYKKKTRSQLAALTHTKSPKLHVVINTHTWISLTNGEKVRFPLGSPYTTRVLACVHSLLVGSYYRALNASAEDTKQERHLAGCLWRAKMAQAALIRALDTNTTLIPSV